MSWVILAAIVGSIAVIAYLTWRKWIAPWSQIERLVRQIGRGEQPRTFLVDGGNEARRISLALENILTRQRELDRQIGDRESGQKAILYAMQDGLIVVDRNRRESFVTPNSFDLFII